MCIAERIRVDAYVTTSQTYIAPNASTKIDNKQMHFITAFNNFLDEQR